MERCMRLCLLICFLCTTTNGATLTVATTGTDGGNCTSSNPCKTIQYALDAAVYNDVVYLSPGTYNDPTGDLNLSFGTKNVTLRGASTGSVTIDCMGTANRAFVFDGSETEYVAIERVTVENCNGDQGGAVRIAAGAAPSFVNVVFRGNNATTAGGVVYVTGSTSPVFYNCTLEDNHSEGHGGAVFALAGAKPQFYYCELYGNTAVGEGGGCYSQGTTAQVEFYYSEILCNIATGGGGGAACAASSAKVKLFNSITCGNRKLSDSYAAQTKRCTKFTFQNTICDDTDTIRSLTPDSGTWGDQTAIDLDLYTLGKSASRITVGGIEAQINNQSAAGINVTVGSNSFQGTADVAVYAEIPSETLQAYACDAWTYETVPLGESCHNNAQCAPGACVGGYCCSTSCTNTCESCSVAGSCDAYTSDTRPNGTCALCFTCDGLGGCTEVANGSDTHSDCGVCARCDGSGSCANEPANTDTHDDCGTCFVCDGVGGCTPAVNGTDPAGDCGPCASCDGSGSCVFAAINTDPNQDCLACQACDGGGGCTAALSGTDPKTDCGGVCARCDGGGSCAYVASGLDTYTDCGLCDVCDGLGNCSAAVNGSDPKEECGDCDVCGGDSACRPVAAGTDPDDDCGVCGACDGSGECAPAEAHTDPHSDCSTCLTCSGNFSCMGETAGTDPLAECGLCSVCDGSGGCVAAAAQTDVKGECSAACLTCNGAAACGLVDCDPYVCDGGCLSSCVNDSQCVSPYACSRHSECVATCTNSSDCIGGYECDVNVTNTCFASCTGFGLTACVSPLVCQAATGACVNATVRVQHPLEVVGESEDTGGVLDFTKYGTMEIVAAAVVCLIALLVLVACFLCCETCCRRCVCKHESFCGCGAMCCSCCDGGANAHKGELDHNNAHIHLALSGMAAAHNRDYLEEEPAVKEYVNEIVGYMSFTDSYEDEEGGHGNHRHGSHGQSPRTLNGRSRTHSADDVSLSLAFEDGRHVNINTHGRRFSRIDLTN